MVICFKDTRSALRRLFIFREAPVENKNVREEMSIIMNQRCLRIMTCLSGGEVDACFFVSKNV